MKITNTFLALAMSTGMLSTPFIIKADIGNTGGGGLEIQALAAPCFMAPVSIYYIQGIGVQVYFGMDIDMVLLTVQDGDGFIVSSEMVDTSVQNQYSVDTIGLSSGSYSVTVTNMSGSTVAKSSFTVN